MHAYIHTDVHAYIHTYMARKKLAVDANSPWRPSQHPWQGGMFIPAPAHAALQKKPAFLIDVVLRQGPQHYSVLASVCTETSSTLAS